MRLLLATTNCDKVREIRQVFEGGTVTIVTLADMPAMPEPDETGATFWENARQKALAYAAASGLTAVAEDSGLVIDALAGDPGVRSARYLRPQATYAERFQDLYRRLEGRSGAPYRARFVTALAVARDRTLLYETETRIEGVIAPQPAGTQGFGYDPIFVYVPLGRTTAQLSMEEKNAVSHRARAFRDLRRAISEGRIG